jgi:biopolymer transport protein ExbD
MALLGLAACQPVAEPEIEADVIAMSVDANGKVTGTRNGKPMSEAEIESRVAQAEAKKPLDPTKVVKVAVFRDGRIEIDGASTEAEQVAEKMKAAAAAKKSVVYYRESAEAGLSSRQKGVMPAILGSVAANLLPIRFSYEPDFSDTLMDAQGARTQ